MENIIKQTVDILQEKIDCKQEYGLERLDESKHYQNRIGIKKNILSMENIIMQSM